MKLKPAGSKLCLVLTALTWLPFAHPAVANDQTPFRGVEIGDGVLTSSSFVFPYHYSTDTAEGEATHVGRFTLTSDIAVDVRFGTATGTSTLTAANGDLLFLTLTGYAVAPAFIETVANYTITGGTGRFEGATGSFTAYIQHAFAVNSGVAIDPYVGEFDGTISTPGSHEYLHISLIV
jgi:hypothetical protein